MDPASPPDAQQMRELLWWFVSWFVPLAPFLADQLMKAPTIELAPLPPTQGGNLEITYTGATGTVLELDWDPPGLPKSVWIGPTGVATVTVPRNATSVVVSDPTPNGAVQQSTVVAPH